MDIQKIKGGFNAVQSKIREFVYTDLYIAMVLAIVFIGWISECAPFGFVALILSSCVILVFSDDVLPLSVNAFGAMLMVYTDSLEEFAYLWPTFIPLGIAIVIFVLRNVKNKKFTFGKMFFPQIAVSVALLMGGVGVVAKENYLTALPTVIALGIGVLAVYLLFANFVKKDGKDYAGYFAKTLLYIGIAVSVELIVQIASTGLETSEWASAYFGLGWGNRNNVATILCFTAPMGLYLSTKRKYNVLYIAVAMFEYACLVMTMSRGGILFGAIGGVVGLVFSIINAQNRKKQLVNWAIVWAIILVICLVWLDELKGLLSAINERVDVGEGEDVTSGRFDLYKEAWALFKQHPMFGAGMGYIGTEAGAFNDMSMYWFHSTLFQVLGCMGILGVLAYVYFYAVRVWLVIKGMKKGNKFAFFIFVVAIGFDGYSMIDTGTMVPFPNMMLLLALTFIGELALEDDKHECMIDGVSASLMKECYVREPKAVENKNVKY